MTIFRYSTLSGGENAPVPSGVELIEIVRRRPVWDEITITREDDAPFPRASLSWHEGARAGSPLVRGRAVMGFFLVESGSLTEPEIDIILGDQVQERWPPQLFVDPSRGAEALDHFLDRGKQKETLHWIRMDGFPRETVWKGRAGREAWEQRKKDRKGEA
jgi:hypothetical protein